MIYPSAVGRMARYAIGVSICALPAMAGTTCIFDTECLEGEACAESGFALTVEPEGLVTTAETIPIGDELHADGATAYSGASGSGFHLVSIAEDGTARYSAHIPSAGLTILYIGTCTETG